MSVSVQVLQKHLDYTAWATARLLEAAERLSPEELKRDFQTADRGVLGTLVHIFFADRLWLARIQGAPFPGLPTETESTLEFLRAAFPELHGRWRAWAESLSPDSPLAYQDLKGNRWEQPIWQVLLHVVNHATHHRGQIAGFLRSMGHAPPSLDLIAFYRGRS